MQQSTENQGLSAYDQDSYFDSATDMLGQEIIAGAPFPMTLEDTLEMMDRAQKERPLLLHKINQLQQVIHSMDIELVTAKNDLMNVRFQFMQDQEFCQEIIDTRREEAQLVMQTSKSAYKALENKHHEFIKRSVDQAKRLLNDRDKAQVELRMSARDLKSSVQEKERLGAELANERKRTGRETSRVGQLKQELARKTSESERWNDLNTSLQTQIDKAKQEKSDSETKAMKLEKRYKQLEADNAKFEARLAGSLRRITELQAALTAKNNTAAAVKEDAKATHKELEDRLSEALRENLKLQDKLSTTKSEAGTAKKESAKAEKQLQSRLSASLSQNSELQKTLQAANETNTSLRGTLNQWQMNHSNEINATLAEVARAKKNVMAVEKESASKLENVCRKNSELRAMLTSARYDAAVAKEEAAATKKELRSSLEEALRHKMQSKTGLTATKEIDEEGEAAKKLSKMGVADGAKRSKTNQSANDQKRGGKKHKKPQAQAPLDETITHLQERLADALNETNRYKVENARLQTQQGNKKAPQMRSRSVSDPDPLGTFEAESKNERIAELEAKNAELEASQQGTRDADGAGSLAIYPFELRKIQTLKAQLQQLTEERDELRAKLRKQKPKWRDVIVSRKAAAGVKVLRKEVDALDTKINGAKEYIGKLSDDLAATQAKLSTLEA